MEEKNYQSAKIPLHQQISDWVKLEIREKRLQIDDKLPSENDMATQFNVSRLTVRRALQTLEQENLIFRSQGLGAFVKAPISRKKMVRLNSFNEDLSQAGISPSTEIVNQSVVQPPVFVQHLLGIDEGKKVYLIERVRLGSARPYAYDRTWLPAFYGQLLEDADLENRSIFDILENDYEIVVQRGCQRFDAAIANATVANYLDISEGTAVLMMKRLVSTPNGKAVYYQERSLRTDRFSYEMILERTPETELFSHSSAANIKSFQPVIEPKEDVFSMV